MKKILTVFKFEIGNYMSKSFLIPTIILCILCIGIMFFPRVKESFTSDGKADTEESASGEDGSDEEIDVFAIYDPNGYTEMTGVETLEQMFGEGKVEIISSDEEVKRMVENEEAKAGFSIKSLDSYDYYSIKECLMPIRMYFLSI